MIRKPNQLAWIITILFLLYPLLVSALTLQVQEEYMFQFTVLDSDGAWVTGETPTLEIIRASDGFFYHFTNDNFQEASHTYTLDEETNYYYYYTWDPPSSETTARTYTFFVTNTGTYAHLQGEQVHYEDVIGMLTILDTVADRIEVDTASIETKIDIADAVVDRIEVDTISIETKMDTADAAIDVNTAHLTDIKGSGWADETLVALMVEAEDIYTMIGLMAGSGFNTATDSLEELRDRGDNAWLSCETTEFAGVGDTSIDENYGGEDELAYLTAGLQGIDNAIILAYLKTDYDAGNYGKDYIQGVSRTTVDGSWVGNIQLDCGFTYTLIFYKQKKYGPNTEEVTVVCP